VTVEEEFIEIVAIRILLENGVAAVVLFRDAPAVVVSPRGLNVISDEAPAAFPFAAARL